MKIVSNSEARPSFELEKLVPPTPEWGEAMARLVAGANGALDQGTAARIGVLSLSWAQTVFNLPDWQIGSRALPSLDGGGLRFPVSCDAFPPDVERIMLDSLVRAAWSFAGAADRVRPRVQEARSVVADAIGRHQGRFEPAKLVGIGVQTDASHDMFSPLPISIEIETLNDDLTPMPMRFPVKEPADARRWLDDALARHAGLASLLASIEPFGGAALISDVARRVMSSAGIDLLFVLSAMRRERSHAIQLTDRNSLSFRFDRRRKAGRLFWSDGVLQAAFHQKPETTWRQGRFREGPDPGSEGFRISGTTLTLDDALPETMRQGLAGTRLGHVVQHPLIPPDATIMRAASMVEHVYDRHTRVPRDRTVLTLRIPVEPLTAHDLARIAAE